MPIGSDATTRRPDGSMSLLVDLTASALDPSYAEVSQRRAAAAASPTPARPLQRLFIVSVLAVGLAVGVIGAQARRHAVDLDAARRALVHDVDARTAATDRLADQAATLRAQVTRSRLQALGVDSSGRAAEAQVEALELATGAVAVQGPGLVVTLNDASGSQSSSSERGGQAGEGRIYDRDIQDVVNALWASGAEAISVNDQRVTAQTAIRSAGEAILVDLRPLSPPYVLRAVGDVNTLEPTFVDGAVARRFQTWTSLYGLGFDVKRADNLQLPAANAPDLHLARAGQPS